MADSETKIKQKLLANLKELYSLGANFEPEKYFTISRDAPYASSVALEWRGISADFSADIYEADFKDLLLFDENRIQVVIS